MGHVHAGAFINAQRVTVREIPIRAAEAPAGLKMVQISDVHIGSRRAGFLERVVARVNMLEPDMVMITGDLIDFRAIGEDELASLSTLDAPAYFCTGNHDYGPGGNAADRTTLLNRYFDVKACARWPT